ncbi:MAG: hypothetical protein RDU25_01590 [Patescibacteria group bacterium]|nr:hypothetical protein [Patescibacteria group bacterium]
MFERPKLGDPLPTEDVDHFIRSLEMLIELRRHSLKGIGNQKDVLSPEGIGLARRVGKEQMHGRGYTHIAMTSLFRTAQTACAFAEGAGDFSGITLFLLEALNSRRMAEWRAYFQKHDVTLVTEDDLIITESGRMAVQFNDICFGLFAANPHLLCIGHTPFIECLVYGLTDKVVDPLKECEGVILDFDGRVFALVEEKRL